MGREDVGVGPGDRRHDTCWGQGYEGRCHLRIGPDLVYVRVSHKDRVSDSPLSTDPSLIHKTTTDVSHLDGR